MRNRLAAALACIAIASALHAAQPTAPGADPSINKGFVDDADPAVWAGRLEGESREIYRKRAEIVDASGAKAGMTIADVGAGTGLFTMLFAKRVAPDGRVIAVDISKNFLEAIAKRAAQEGL